MNFEYLRTETYQDSIDIDDIGNCTINVINDEGREWYAVINTKLGWTTVTTFGPLIVDSDEAVTNLSIYHCEFDYSDKKNYKFIRDFINDPKKSVTQVLLDDLDSAKERLNTAKKMLIF